MRGEASISPIYRHGKDSDARDPLEIWGRLEGMRRRAWQNSGVIAVRPDELPADLARELKRWAEANYGER